MRDPRSWLFVPGDRPERFDKAASASAHAVVCDLEDAVLPARKDQARAHVRSWIESGGTAFVRINRADSPWFDDDLDAFGALAGARGLLLPKCEDSAAIIAVRVKAVDKQLVALVETARGLTRIAEIAAAPGVGRLGFGSYDYAADLNIAHTSTALLHARSTVVMASRAAELDAPLDGVTAAFRDRERNQQEAGLSRELGFGGKMCIHPAQVAPINDAFAPTADEIGWARQVTEAASTADHGAVEFKGQLIDEAVVRRAHRILAELKGTPCQ